MDGTSVGRCGRIGNSFLVHSGACVASIHAWLVFDVVVVPYVASAEQIEACDAD